MQEQKVPESFRAWDPAVLSQLPIYVQESFPFILTKKSAVHKDIVNDLRDNVVKGGKSFKACAEGIRQMHLVRYHDQEMRYYSKLLWDRKTPSVGIPVKEEVFSEFGNRRGYNGYSPSAHYLRSLWHQVQERRPVARLDKYVKGVKGEVRWQNIHNSVTTLANLGLLVQVGYFCSCPQVTDYSLRCRFFYISILLLTHALAGGLDS